MVSAKLIDTHCHVHFQAFKEDSDQVIENTLKRGVYMNLVGTQRDTSAKAVAVAERFPGTFASVGLHPVHLFSQHLDEEESSFQTREEDFDYEYYKKLATNQKTIAIGECGLDLYRLPEGIDQATVLAKQVAVFKQHVALSYEVGLPLAIHVRDAYTEMLEVLRNELVARNKKQIQGVIHCYISNWTNAAQFLDLGLYLGFTGIITFPPRKSNPGAQEDLWEVVKKCPLDRIVLETDSPYLAPGVFRGKRAEPWMVEEVAKKIAELKGVGFAEVAATTTLNARRLFTKII